MQQHKLIYPIARRNESIVDTIAGIKVPDPYRWLEDPDCAETREYVQQLNNVSQPFLDACPFKDRIKCRLTEMWNYPKYGSPRREGDFYFYSFNSGLQNQSVIYIQKALDSEASVFMDPNLWSSDGTTAISFRSHTEDGSLLAYGVSEKGSDWITVKFKAVPSGQELTDVLNNVKFSGVSWKHDREGVFYAMYPSHKGRAKGTDTSKHEFHSLFYHKLGTNQNEDILCYDFPDYPNYMMGSEVTDDGDYLIVDVSKGCDPMNLVYFYDLRATNYQITGRLPLEH